VEPEAPPIGQANPAVGNLSPQDSHSMGLFDDTP
jgi:hypothetical protein